jgi:hypothetical protein
MSQKQNKESKDVAADVWREGVLVHTEFRAWGATAKLDDEQLPDELPPEIVRAVRDLLTPEGMALLKDFNRVRNEAKGWLYRNSLPFPVQGMVFVRKSRLEQTDERLQAFQAQALEIAEEFIKQVKVLEEQYAQEYPKFYDPAKYPSEAQLRSRFVFRWSFRSFEPPDSKFAVLSPDMYKREVDKFNSDIRWMRDATSKMFAKAVIDRLGELKKQCEDGTVYSQTVDSVNALIDKFDNLFTGYVSKDSLVKLMDDVKLYMQGTDAEMLRADDDFRAVVGRKMDSVVDTFVKESGTIELSRGFEL